ncbi:MAG TPA: TetR/AcrR family transcriptional regulator [Baekduia sp.]|uniref:TetR/AcrR family transcriptional regulator n=1 Tax=Baekduia sp. TaxID=2600305 RepID=UPI002D769129|nr:TetR/AcrR family transcriptional regulator [Baekduia sp.]HET6509062.1 TetR/AcrR family transcriptional regulator [Baekduia sp.]
MNLPERPKTRQYRMRERAASTAATRQRIIDATLELYLEQWFDDITLKQIAARAGVALQTVVNHFGTKEDVAAAVLEYQAEGRLARPPATPDDVAGAIDILIDNYEHVGDAVIRALALEVRRPALRTFLDGGRADHRRWVEASFPAALTGLRGAARQRRLDLLACATDVYTWKLLRRDRGLGAAATKKAIRELVEALHP